MDRDDIKALGARLKAARLAAGFARREDAEERMAMPNRGLEALEQGQRTPDLATAMRLAELYQTHPAVLLFGETVLQSATLTAAAHALRRAAELLTSEADALSVAPDDLVALTRTAATVLAESEAEAESSRQGKGSKGPRTKLARGSSKSEAHGHNRR